MRLSAALPLVLVACTSAPVADDGGLDASSDTPVVDAVAVDAPLREVALALPPSTVDLPGGVTREHLELEGSVPRPNPESGDATPGEQNRIRIVRLRPTTGEARAVIIAMPGLFASAGCYTPLAESLVRASIAAGRPVEVWTLDRRSNVLEDTTGLDVAEVMGDPSIARDYYAGRASIGGRRFAGFVPPASLRHMSEWGLAVHVDDLRRVIEVVPAAQRRERVILMGHSLGGTFAETFAAWRFVDGTRGSDLLAGVVLVDGLQGETPLTEEAFHRGTSAGVFSVTGVDSLRRANPVLTIPVLGQGVYVEAEILALETRHEPMAVRSTPERARMLSFLLATSALPPMTNRGALGLAFDDASNGLPFAAVAMGTTTGPMESYTSVFGSTLLRPSDPAQTYDWRDAMDAEPAEPTPTANLIAAWVDGRTNFAEWYFPARLPLDLAACGGLAIPTDGWASREGLRCHDGAAMDAPVLAIATALQSVADHASSRLRGAPIGAGRPNAGALRSTDAGYRVLDATWMTHMDPLTGADTARNEVPEAILAFVAANTPETPGLTIRFPSP